MKYHYSYQQTVVINETINRMYSTARGVMSSTQSVMLSILTKLSPSITLIPKQIEEGRLMHDIGEDFELPKGMTITSSLDSILLTQKNPYVIMGYLKGEKRLVGYIDIDTGDLESEELKVILTKLHARQLYAATLTAQLLPLIEDTDMSHLNGHGHFMPNTIEIDGEVIKTICSLSDTYSKLIADSEVDETIKQFIAEEP